ncbi:hypothetical protein SAMN04487761_10387 [Lachnospiraceae bacterium C7]|nr:hypothetical protein SAMN04487761_10387 [Lachnospiraceae bacterium C7]
MATQDFTWIASICRQEGLDVKKVRKSAEYLLKNYYKAKRTREFQEPTVTKPHDICQQKQKIRREYLLIMTGASRKDFNNFIWNALSASWIDEKIKMILDEISGYEEVGPLYKTIIEETYLKKNKLTREELYAACGLGRTAYFDRRKEAVTLFGILTWKYAQRREIEDVDQGIVEPTAKLGYNDE